MMSFIYYHYCELVLDLPLVEKKSFSEFSTINGITVTEKVN